MIPAVIRRPNQDVLAGLMFTAFGALAMILGRDYPVGSSSQMGSGYFPMVLGSLLVVVGLALTTVGLRRGGAGFEGWSFRASFFICTAFLLFAAVIEWAGLLLTAPACTMIAALGSARFRLVPQLVLAVVASLVAVAIFWGLKIPIPLLPRA